jgi:hypothetical protein
MSYPDSVERMALIAGLREMATFLESNPDVPAPPDTVLFVFPKLNSTDGERREEVDVVASRIRSRASYTAVGHYTASRFFGPVEYRAIAIDHETPGSTEGA